MGALGKDFLHLHLSGVFRVTLTSGEDITPKSKLRCAILAVIAAANGQSISRARLQEMFWGNSSPDHASGSLRSALYQLRRDFSQLEEDPFEIRPTHVSLKENRWEISRKNDGTEFLEGMDLSLAGAESFEDWLREERQSAIGQSSGNLAPAYSKTVDAVGSKSCALGLLPVVVATEKLGAEEEANSFLLGVLRVLSQLSSISLFDLRGGTLRDGELRMSQASQQTLVLKSTVVGRGRKLTLLLGLHAPQSGRLVATLPPLNLSRDDLESDVVNIAELVLGAFSYEGAHDQIADLMPWAALSSLFSLTDEAVISTETELDRLLAQHSSPTLECLKVFLQIFKENEGLSIRVPYSAADLIATLERVPVTQSQRALCESLIGYSAHMLLGDNDLSDFLLKLADQREPNLALNLDHLAVLNLARGDLGAASRAHNRCMRLGSMSSWRYSYDVTGAMIAMASGDYLTALRLSNQSLMQRPRFIGALRYTMIGLAMNNSPENALLMKSRIAKLRPGYDLTGWVEGFLGRSDPVFANNVALTLQRHELI